MSFHVLSSSFFFCQNVVSFDMTLYLHALELGIPAHNKAIYIA